MAISETYLEILTEQIIKNLLDTATSPTVPEITEQIEEYQDTYDLNEPIFSADDFTVEELESASASKYNNSNEAILQDLKVAYRHLFKTTNTAIYNFDRWRLETRLLEKRLNILTDKLDALLLVNRDTAGFFDFVQDNFDDQSKVDSDNTTALVDTDKGIVVIGTTTADATKIDLTSLTNKDVVFSVLTKNNLVSRVASAQSQTKHAIQDASNFWQERVNTNKPGPVTTELRIDLKESKSFSRLDVDLHASNQMSTVQVTPLYSTDDYNWQNFPAEVPTKATTDRVTFRFTEVAARYLKLLMTKSGPDQFYKDLYTYEFGVDSISLFAEGFTVNQSSTLLSNALSVLDHNGNPKEFSKVALEVCEEVPDDTSIEYYVSAFNDADNPPGTFINLDPINRESSFKPTILDFGELSETTVSGVQISYDTIAASSEFVNPAQAFNFITDVSGGEEVVASGEASDLRYSIQNSNERLLNYELTQDVSIAQGTLQLWRNVSLKADNTKVRGVANGWGFDDPWYKTTVLVRNPEGFDVDFGGEKIIVDGVQKTGLVSFTEGRHVIQVHKDNWQVINHVGITNLVALKAADSLYPYNHRYLVEGFSYPTNYTGEKIYLGFDIVAEYLMEEVSVFDLTNNIASDDYSKFARDLDGQDDSRLLDGIAAATDAEKAALVVFLVKVKESDPDFLNEKYLLSFKAATTLYKYLQFKAVLTTKDTSLTPILDSYRLKISN